MVKKIEKLFENDVIHTSEPNFLGLSKTFKMVDLLIHIQSILQEKDRNSYNLCEKSGYHCQVLQESGGGWKYGHFRISLEFITEVEEADLENEALSLNKEQSVLDPIRKTNLLV